MLHYARHYPMFKAAKCCADLVRSLQGAFTIKSCKKTVERCRSTRSLDGLQQQRRRLQARRARHKLEEALGARTMASLSCSRLADKRTGNHR